MESRIRLGVSSCLLGAEVRFDGGHKRDRYLTDVLGGYVDYVPVCPEVEVGLPIPRPALRLVRDSHQDVRLRFSKGGEDITDKMQCWAHQRVRQLESEQLDGFIFKAKSPSSGMERVKIYPEAGGMPDHHGIGMFARIFMEHFPLLPVEEEGRLHDPKLRENFITRIFTMKRLRETLAAGSGYGGMVDFHSRHKLLILAHSEKIYREMGRLVAHGKTLPFETFQDQYRTLLLKAMSLKTTEKKQVNVLQHILGYFKKQLSADEKSEVLEKVEDYRNGLVPLIVPITLLNHYVRKYKQDYLQEQVYLNPHPKELKLLNHV